MEEYSTIVSPFSTYIVGKELGKGAFGVVHLAEDKNIGYKVAIKKPVSENYIFNGEREVSSLFI